MTDEERKAWTLWIGYCHKLRKWYAANPEKAAEYEPIMIMPPFDAIVESNISADAELNEYQRLLDEEVAASSALTVVGQFEMRLLERSWTPAPAIIMPLEPECSGRMLPICLGSTPNGFTVGCASEWGPSC